ncbi:uncharacterized protein LOC143148406 [Ptiloglossa arizonensis]|uniref:uncharacterized protein LOC143148406 n=1 Tax=Ptiloglossa arizonensis TaxID=3350558 RepID=UPI003FA04186
MDEGQQLFLIEFLVDRVKIPMIRAIQDELLPACTCVSFQILGLPAIDVSQDALTDGCGCTDNDTQIFKKGKSCLFALPSVVLQKPLSTFPIKLSVYKKLPPEVLPDVMMVGCHQIEAKALMNAVLSQQVFKIPNPCQTIKDTFRITTATGQCVGWVTVYLRVSGFGRKIVTQFQIPHNRKPYLFKGADESPIFQCKKIPSASYAPAKVKCTCAKNIVDGSGESARRTCCPTPTVSYTSPPAKIQQPEWGARPCCPSQQASPGYLLQTYSYRTNCTCRVDKLLVVVGAMLKGCQEIGPKGSQFTLGRLQLYRCVVKLLNRLLKRINREPVSSVKLPSTLPSAKLTENNFFFNVPFILRKHSSSCPCSSPHRQDQQASCPPYCAPKPGQLVKFGAPSSSLRQQIGADGKCHSSCPTAIQQQQEDACPSCCAASHPTSLKGYKSFSDLPNKESKVKKCGCPVKEYSCNCGQTK